MKKHKKITVEFRLWFYSNGEKLLGKGRVELLERINKTGSISNAAKGMKMSYRQAWQMVTEMNERAQRPLVEKQLGGKSGGGAQLTEVGKNMIHVFHELDKKIKKYIGKKSSKVKR